MSELPHDDLSWELASAYLDREATPDERARVEADPVLLSLVAELSGVQTLVAAPVGAPPAALLSRTLATVPAPLALRRRGRALPWVGGLAVAAAVTAFVGLGGLKSTGSDQKSAGAPVIQQAESAATTAASARARELGVEEVSATTGDAASAASTARIVATGASTTTVAASGAASTAAATVATTAPTLQRSDFNTLSDLTAAKSASPSVTNPTCTPPTTATVFVSVVTLRGEKVELFRSENGTVLIALRPDGCAVIESVGA